MDAMNVLFLVLLFLQFLMALWMNRSWYLECQKINKDWGALARRMNDDWGALVAQMRRDYSADCEAQRKELNRILRDRRLPGDEWKGGS